MHDRAIQIERAQNLWGSFVRKFDPLSRGAEITANPDLDFDRIGGLAGPKEELLTYAFAATSRKAYSDWGTYPPSGLMLIGRQGVGKNLLARALATRTQTSFVQVLVPRLVLDVVHAGGKVGEWIQGWSQILEEMPPLTVYFDELEFSQTQEIGFRRMDLPIGQIMDFLLEMVDRTIAAEAHLVVGATSHPDTIRPAFIAPGRFERLVEVTPSFPGDVIEALQIHADDAEERAGRKLFENVDWSSVVEQTREPSTGDWIRILHAALRRKARCQAAGEQVTLVSTSDLRGEAERFHQTQRQIRTHTSGNYV